MNFWQIAPLVLALLPILYRGWRGWSDGAPCEFRHVLTNLFAVLVTLRFWQPFTGALGQLVALDPQWIAVCAFVILYLAAYFVSGFAFKLRAQVFQSVAANPLDHVLGVLAGLISGSLLGGSLALLATFAVPRPVEPLPSAAMAAEWPEQVFKAIESDLAGVASTDPAHTRFPDLSFKEERLDPTAPPDADGMIAMRMVPVVTWN